MHTWGLDLGFLKANLHKKETKVPWIPSPLQGRYKMSLDIFIVPKSKEVLKWGHVRKTQELSIDRRNSQWPNLRQF